jgi:hypothetical protein
MTACELGSIWICSTRTYCDQPFRNRRNVSPKWQKCAKADLPPSLGRDGRRMKAASRTIANSRALALAARPCLGTTARCCPDICQPCHDTALVHGVARQFLIASPVSGVPIMFIASTFCVRLRVGAQPTARLALETYLGRIQGWRRAPRMRIASLPLPSLDC